METVPTCLQIPWRQSNSITDQNINVIANDNSTNQENAPNKVFAVIVVSTDTLDHELQLGIMNHSEDFYVLGTVMVPAQAGSTSTVPSVNVMTSIPALPLDETGQPHLYLDATDSLEVKVLSPISDGCDIDVTVFGADF
jgi:hypothetical protein